MTLSKYPSVPFLFLTKTCKISVDCPLRTFLPIRHTEFSVWTHTHTRDRLLLRSLPSAWIAYTAAQPTRCCCSRPATHCNKSSNHVDQLESSASIVSSAQRYIWQTDYVATCLAMGKGWEWREHSAQSCLCCTEFQIQAIIFSVVGLGQFNVIRLSLVERSHVTTPAERWLVHISI